MPIDKPQALTIEEMINFLNMDTISVFSTVSKIYLNISEAKSASGKTGKIEI